MSYFNQIIQILTKKYDHFHTQASVFWILCRNMMTKGPDFKKKRVKTNYVYLMLLLAGNIKVYMYVDSNMKYQEGQNLISEVSACWSERIKKKEYN